MRCSARRSTPGRIAAASTRPRKTSAIRIFSFQSASAAATTATATSVATNVRRAVSPIYGTVLAVDGWPQTQEWSGVRRSGASHALRRARGGLLRRAPARRRPRAPARAGSRVRVDGRHSPGSAVAAARRGRGARGARGHRLPERGLALGAHAPGPDDGEALPRRRDAPAPQLDGAPARRREPRARAIARGEAARLRHPGGRDPGDRARAAAAQRLPDRRAAGRLMAAPPVEVRGLTKRYGSTTAVDDLTFSIPAGKITGFLGPNGAGKTTTLRAVLGLVHATSGEARV